MNDRDGCRVDGIDPGVRAVFANALERAGIGTSANASGDDNAAHFDDAFARSTSLEARIAGTCRQGFDPRTRAPPRLARRSSSKAVRARVGRAIHPPNEDDHEPEPDKC